MPSSTLGCTNQQINLQGQHFHVIFYNLGEIVLELRYFLCQKSLHSQKKFPTEGKDVEGHE